MNKKYIISTPYIFGEGREDVGSYYKRIIEQAKAHKDYISKRNGVEEVFVFLNDNGVERHAYLPIELVEQIVEACSIDAAYCKDKLV